MKRLFVALAILTPWITQSMEPQVAYAQDIPVETATEDAGRWVRLVEEILPGEIPLRASTRISQILAQKLLIQKPHIRQYILSHLSLPFKNFSAKPGKKCGIYFNPAGDKMATLGERARIPRIWDAQTGKLLFTIKGHKDQPTITFSPNGDKILTHSRDTTRIWDAQTGKLLCALEGFYFEEFNPNGDKILTRSFDAAKIWDAQTGKLLCTLNDDNHKVYFATFNPTGNKILTLSVDTASSADTARIWDTQTGRPIHTLRLDIKDSEKRRVSVRNLAGFIQAGNQIITWSPDDTLKIWDTETGELIQTFQEIKQSLLWHNIVHHYYGVHQVLWDSRTGKLLSYESANKIIANVRTLTKIETLLNNYRQRPWSPWETTFNSTGNLILESEAKGKIAKIRIWDLEAGEVLHAFRDLQGPTEFDPTGEKLVTASTDGTYKIWDLEPLLSCKKFLVEEIGHLQAAILLDIFQVIETRHYANVLCQIAASLVNRIKIEQDKVASPEAQRKIARAVAALNKLKRARSLRNITFDFNRYPHLWDMYEAMPEAIRQVCDPYITKPSLEQDLKRPSSSPEQPSKRLKIATENVQ